MLHAMQTVGLDCRPHLIQLKHRWGASVQSSYKSGRLYSKYLAMDQSADQSMEDEGIALRMEI